MKPIRWSMFGLLLIALHIGTTTSAHAYIGPGAGIAAIGTVLALIGGVLLAVLAFVWYPIKRLLQKVKRRKQEDGSD